MPIIAALVGLTILVPAVGFIWFGWWDIPQNRKVLDSLPLPPGAELIDVDSEPNYTADTLVYPDSWSTLATYRIPDHTPEYLTEFYIQNSGRNGTTVEHPGFQVRGLLLGATWYP